MKHILIFIAGIIAGIVGVELYGIFVKPTLPSEPKWIDDNGDEWTVITFGVKNDPDDTQPVKVSEG